MQSPSSLEVKAHGLFHNLDHRTLQTDLGSILGNLKWTLFPSFLLPGGRPFELKVEATEQTGLQPKSFKDLKGEVKVYAPKNVTLTSSFLPCGKKVSLGAKVKQPIAGHATEGELKWTKGKPVAGEVCARHGRHVDSTALCVHSLCTWKYLCNALDVTVVIRLQRQLDCRQLRLSALVVSPNSMPW